MTAKIRVKEENALALQVADLLMDAKILKHRRPGPRTAIDPYTHDNTEAVPEAFLSLQPNQSQCGCRSEIERIIKSDFERYPGQVKAAYCSGRAGAQLEMKMPHYI